jgi:diacylglycerol kinase family enzyme
MEQEFSERTGGLRFVVILNRHGGALRAMDMDAFSDEIRSILGGQGHQVDIRVASRHDVGSVLGEIADARGMDVLLAGGGDGTISAAAATAAKSNLALAVLPAGTMNLFARSLQIPLALDQALHAFATGRIRMVDMGSANGRPFVHQFSIGMHARLVELRSRMVFSSRLGKIRASIRAAIETIRNPSSVHITIGLDDGEIVVETAGISVANNLYGEGHLPFADKPDGGVLGVYVGNAGGRAELLRLCFKIGIGRWRDNDQVEIHQSKTVSIKIHDINHRRRAVIDGELIPLGPETIVKIHPQALRVLVPRETVERDEALTAPAEASSPIAEG